MHENQGTPTVQSHGRWHGRCHPPLARGSCLALVRGTIPPRWQPLYSVGLAARTAFAENPLAWYIKRGAARRPERFLPYYQASRGPGGRESEERHMRGLVWTIGAALLVSGSDARADISVTGYPVPYGAIQGSTRVADGALGVYGWCTSPGPLDLVLSGLPGSGGSLFFEPTGYDHALVSNQCEDWWGEVHFELGHGAGPSFMRSDGSDGAAFLSSFRAHARPGGHTNRISDTFAVFSGAAVTNGPAGFSLDGRVWMEGGMALPTSSTDLTLRITPVVPAPGVLALSLPAGLLSIRRRRPK